MQYNRYVCFYRDVRRAMLSLEIIANWRDRHPLPLVSTRYNESRSVIGDRQNKFSDGFWAFDNYFYTKREPNFGKKNYFFYWSIADIWTKYYKEFVKWFWLIRYTGPRLKNNLFFKKRKVLILNFYSKINLWNLIIKNYHVSKK